MLNLTKPMDGLDNTTISVYGNIKETQMFRIHFHGGYINQHHLGQVEEM